MCSPAHCETNCTLNFKYLLNDFDSAFFVDRQLLSLETKIAFTVEFYGEDIFEDRNVHCIFLLIKVILLY